MAEETLRTTARYGYADFCVEWSGAFIDRANAIDAGDVLARQQAENTLEDLAVRYSGYCQLYQDTQLAQMQ